jgi:hypothetical protein
MVTNEVKLGLSSDSSTDQSWDCGIKRNKTGQAEAGKECLGTELNRRRRPFQIGAGDFLLSFLTQQNSKQQLYSVRVC